MIPRFHGQPAAQQPDWLDQDTLRGVVTELRRRAPLVAFEDCHRLGAALAEVEARRSVVLQVGDCAERFAEANPVFVAARVAQIDRLATTLRTGTGLDPVRLGRLAGQYAKPRSADTEVLPNGGSVPVYRGDSVNSESPTAANRRADPRRLLRAYDCSRVVLDELAVLCGDRDARVFSTHEALLLDYEHALVRQAPGGTEYLSSAHGFWIGERTRHVDGPHIALAAAMSNPVAVKIGPDVSIDDAVALSRILNPDGRPGRLSFIVRMGAQRVATALPPVVAAVARRGAPVNWICDPMHGNTIRTGTGGKTRVTADINREVTAFVTTLLTAGQWPAGIHLETTPERVMECVDTPAQATDPELRLVNRSACDPRLTSAQAESVVSRFARLLAGNSEEAAA